MALAPISKKAVVLSGGGAYGAYEVGILKALTSGASPATNGLPLELEVATGTSVGAFNAALLTMYSNRGGAAAAKAIEAVWLNEVADVPARGNGVYRIRGNPLRYLDPAAFTQPADLFRAMSDAMYLTQDWSIRLLRFASAQGSLAHRTADLFDISSFLSVEPFAAMLGRTLDFEAIGESPLSLSVVATNWNTGGTKVFTNRDISASRGAAAIMASAAIPGIFPPVKVDGAEFVDGGVVLNTPLSTALNAGATELHVIYMSPAASSMPTDKAQATIDVFDRVYHIMLATKISEDIMTARWINEGLTVVANLATETGESPNVSLEAERSFIRVANVIHRRIGMGRPYRPVTIHRYFPRKALGDALAMLDFAPRNLREMIDLGETDGRLHDCAAAGCVLRGTPA